MADAVYTPEEIIEVWAVPASAIADLDAPTVDELTSGTRITGFVTDGPPSPSGTNFVDAGTLLSGFQAQAASTYGGGSGTFTILRKRDDQTTDESADDAYNLFERGSLFVFAIYDYGVSGDNGRPEAGDVVSLYPFEVGNRAPVRTRGSLMVANVDVAFNDLPHENVDVVAGSS